MNYLKKISQPVVWTDDLLSAFTPKQLRLLANFVEGVSLPLERDLRSFYETYPPKTSRDQAAAQEYAARKEAGDIMKAGSLEESAMQRGAYVQYSEEHVWIHKTSGEIEMYYNAVVPIASAGKRARQGLFSLVSIFAAIVKVNGEQLAFNVPASIWEKHWGGKEMVIRPAQIFQALSLLDNTFSQYPKWTSLSLSTRQSLTDVRWVAFLVDFFNTCSWVDYFACHSVIAYEFLKIFRRTMKGQYVVWLTESSLGKCPFVPAQSYIVVTEKVAAKMPAATARAATELRKLMKRDPIVLLGPFSTKHRTVDTSDADFAKARKSMEAGNIIRGGEASGASVLANANGFSGLVTKLSKSTMLTISAILSVARKCEEIDVYMESIGPIPVVHQSVTNALKTGQIARAVDIQFVVAFADVSKVQPDYAKWVSTKFRASAHRIWISTKTIPSEKGELKVLEKTSDMMKDLGAEFTYYGPIFGPYPFTSRFTVFSHGWPSDFKGFVSTAIDSLVGAKVLSKGIEIVGIKEKVFPSETKWYEEVIISNFKKNAYFLRPAKNFCTISNLMIPPTKGVAFVIRDSAYEYGSTGAATDFIEEEDDYSEEADHYDDEEEGELDQVREEIEQTHGFATNTSTSSVTFDLPRVSDPVTSETVEAEDAEVEEFDDALDGEGDDEDEEDDDDGDNPLDVPPPMVVPTPPSIVKKQTRIGAGANLPSTSSTSSTTVQFSPPVGSVRPPSSLLSQPLVGTPKSILRRRDDFPTPVREEKEKESKTSGHRGDKGDSTGESLIEINEEDWN